MIIVVKFLNLSIQSSGITVYFGLAFAASEFFTSNGFPCPPFMIPSDHLLKTINKDFDQVVQCLFWPIRRKRITLWFK
ncbi:ABC transporter G family member 15-like [Cajanus cajan]|uniref:ABC transporter G family member 15-like n=1 Tax=Cajanus cajan TaxID=3821 RepID=UPI0010FB6D98|nr:ABC transporter G family member 15-like [Cajanus cajan]